MSERPWVCTVAAATSVASIHDTWLPRGSLDGQTVHSILYFSRGEGYYLLWGLTMFPGDRLNLSHLYCFATDVPVNCSLGFKDFQKWISTESDSVKFFLKKLGFVQILPHLCSNNPDITFSLLSLSLISSRLLYRSTDMIYMLVKVTWIHQSLFYFLKILPNQGAQKSHWRFIQILRSLLN